MYTYTMPRPKKPKPRIRTNIYLDADQKEALERLSESTRVKVAEYVREGVDLVLERYKKHLQRSKK